MQMSAAQKLTTVTDAADDRSTVAAEHALLRDVFKHLPAGVTVQDEDGRFLLLNDTAASQLGVADTGIDGRPSPELSRRREHGREMVREGRSTVAEENVGNGPLKQVLLTAHPMARLGSRNL